MMLSKKMFGARLIGPVAVVVVSLTAGCSSTSEPYYRGGGAPPVPAEVSNDQLRARVMLVGDAGAPEDCDSAGNKKCTPAVLDLLEKWASKAPERTVTLFLGDNIYPDGLPEASVGDREEAEEWLRAQYRVLSESGSRGVFVPGNHDWDGSFGPRHEVWARQLEFLKGDLDRERQLLAYADIQPGCPWPAYVDIELDAVGIIVMDTQWWLTADEKLHRGCKRSTPNEQAVATKLERLLAQAGPDGGNPRDVIVATHHPLATHGVHGRWYRWFSQDLRGYRNRAMRGEIAGAYERSEHPPLIHAAGHDHSLQVLDGTDTGGIGYNLVSGAGSPEKIASVSSGEDTLFSHDHTGFMVIDFLTDGSVWLRVVEPVEGGGGQVVYADPLRVAAAR